jgi:hypothetical protein
LESDEWVRFGHDRPVRHSAVAEIIVMPFINTNTGNVQKSLERLEG